MGFWDKIKGEFVDIIEWTDDTSDTLVWRFPRYQNEIKQGAKLTVRETQVAIFVSQGQIAEVYQPGLHTLQTQNMPLLTTIMGFPYGFNSPFKAEVYFVSTKTFTDRKWGTKNPVMMRDADFGVIRLRAFGNFALKVKDPVKLVKDVSGTSGHFTTDGITDQLRNVILTRFTDAIAESKIPALDLAQNYDEISKLVQVKIQPEFEEYGLELTKFLVENISLPPEVEKAIDKKTSMGVVGNLNQYTQYQMAESMEKAAANPGGEASSGIGMGMGFAMANQMAQNMGGQQGGPPPLPGSSPYFAAINGAQAGPFDQATLSQMIAQGKITRDTLVWKQGQPSWIKASEASDLQQLFPPPLA